MSERHETCADIIAAMRSEGHTGPALCLEWVGTKMRYYAHRLEAAHKREHGDCAKLREALRECAQYIVCVGGIGIGEVTINDNVRLIPEELAQKAIAALAAPPRNCDVGTAEEQAERFKTAKCDSLPKCKPWDECCLTCFARWSQMPYEEGDEK